GWSLISLKRVSVPCIGSTHLISLWRAVALSAANWHGARAFLRGAGQRKRQRTRPRVTGARRAIKLRAQPRVMLVRAVEGQALGQGRSEDRGTVEDVAELGVEVGA